MERNTTVTLILTQEELQILHTALCEHRVKLGNMISQLTSFELLTDDAQALGNRLAELSRRMCAKLEE